jgi:chloramphenicol 3-O phosphotransferase
VGTTENGLIVVLNGAPRSGKSSIASAIQATFDGLWLNLGVDAFSRGITPARHLPGIGLRPGGERPDLEPFLRALFDALYESVIAQSRLGLNVVVDVGHHDDYSSPLGILDRVSQRLRDLPAYFVGVRCPLESIMDRRAAEEGVGPGCYLTRGLDGEIPDPVLRWERAVHDPGMYDAEVDTGEMSPEQCAEAIEARILRGPPTAFTEISELNRRR